jgi:hypothetical protein
MEEEYLPRDEEASFDRETLPSAPRCRADEFDRVQTCALIGVGSVIGGAALLGALSVSP